MYSIVLMMALSNASTTPQACPQVISYGCCGCYGGYYHFDSCGNLVQPGVTPAPNVGGGQAMPGVGGGEQATKPPVINKWPAKVTAKVKAALKVKDLADADADKFIEEAQAFGCKGNDFTDFINVPGVKTQKGDNLREALQVYMRTLKKITDDPTPKKWTDNVVAKVKGTLKDKDLADADADKFIEEAQAFGCKGNDFTDFINVPGVKTQKGDNLREALQVYMRTLKTVRQRQSFRPAPARIYVNLPADAKLTVDGVPTVSTSANRVFVSPTLDQDKTYSYTFKAEIIRDGKVLTATRQVSVRAGVVTRVKLEVPAVSDVASR